MYAETVKARRQAVILDVIQRAPVRSQEQLRRSMRTAGFDVTQATLSRDIRELGLVKGGADVNRREQFKDQSAVMWAASSSSRCRRLQSAHRSR